MSAVRTPASPAATGKAVERRGGRPAPTSPATSAEMALGLHALTSAVELEVLNRYAPAVALRIAERLEAAGFAVRKI